MRRRSSRPRKVSQNIFLTILGLTSRTAIVRPIRTVRAVPKAGPSKWPATAEHESEHESEDDDEEEAEEVPVKTKGKEKAKAKPKRKTKSKAKVKSEPTEAQERLDALTERLNRAHSRLFQVRADFKQLEIAQDRILKEIGLVIDEMQTINVDE